MSSPTPPVRRRRPPSPTKTPPPESTFECNVCFDVPRDPVVTPCGHLYCWPCIFRWMTLHPTTPQCPVCKSAVDQSTIIPIYGRGRAAHDPRDKLPETDVPPRPTGRRIEARVGVQPFGVHPVGFGRFNGNAWGGYDVGVGGFGLFPSLFGLQIAYPQVEAERREEVAAEDGIPELVAKVFLLLAIFIAVIITTF